MTDLPVPYSKVLLLLQGVDESDQEVLVVEKSGEQSDSLLNVGPCVGGLKRRGWSNHYSSDGLNRSAAHTPAVSMQIHSATFVSPVTYL